MTASRDGFQGYPEKLVVKEVTATNGIITIKETTEPSAVADYGKIYTKSDNKLYFQDGAGNEHEIAFA
jgi:hypothetical protein